MLLSSRRRAREVILSALYEVEFGHVTIEQALSHIDAFEALPPDLKQYAEEVARGVTAEQESIDALLQKHVIEYELSRVAAVDRNLLRIAVFELFHCPNVPPKVTLNEAIELGKKYSTADSGRFINGVLASIFEESPKYDWAPPESADDLEPLAPPEPEPETVEVNEGAPELDKAARVGKWKIREEEPLP